MAVNLMKPFSGLPKRTVHLIMDGRKKLSIENCHACLRHTSRSHKMCLLMKKLKQHGKINTVICTTGQYLQMFGVFGAVMNFNLSI